MRHVRFMLFIACTNPTEGTAGLGGTADTAPPVLLPSDDERMELGPELTCTSPATRDAKGPFIRTVYGETWWDKDGTYGGKGMSVEDFDGDGVLDVFIPQAGGSSYQLRGDGVGGFLEEFGSERHNIVDLGGTSLVDIDLDGDIDQVGLAFRNQASLLRNDGTGFYDIEPLPTDVEGCGGTGSWGDMDLDGDLDLFLGRLAEQTETTLEPCGSVLFENRDGELVEVTELLPEEVFHLKAMSAGWLQLDDDPWPELYVVTDVPAIFDGNLRLDFDGKSFTVTKGTGLEIDIAGMGLAVGDLNDDGVWDLAVPGVKQIALLMSSGPFWVDGALAAELVPDTAGGQHWGWGGQFGDVDNDGFLDLPMNFGPGSADEGAVDVPLIQPDELFWNDGTNTFRRVGAEWGLDDTLSMRGYLLVDLNGDGWLDLLKRELGGVMISYVARCGANRWLEVDVEGVDPNPRAIGAVVEIDAGGRTHRRLVDSGSIGYNTSGPVTAHFGLGDLVAVDQIRVVWPNGGVTHHPGVGTNRKVTLRYAEDP
jgi:enediyne biosynthesis protein E4